MAEVVDTTLFLEDDVMSNNSDLEGDGSPLQNNAPTDSDPDEDVTITAPASAATNHTVPDDNDEVIVTTYDEDDEVVELGTPILTLGGKNTLYEKHGCSLARTFCLFCSDKVYDTDSSIGHSCPTKQLKAFARMVYNNTKSIEITVESLKDSYDNTYRDNTNFKHPVTGRIIEAPIWTKESIRTHIEFSDDFPEIKTAFVAAQLHALCYRQSRFLVNSDETTDANRTKQYLETVKVLINYTKMEHTIAMNMHKVRSKAARRQRLRRKKPLCLTN
jgi:hypothetical protein